MSDTGEPRSDPARITAAGPARHGVARVSVTPQAEQVRIATLDASLKRRALLIMSGYALLATLWIYLSDHALLALVADEDTFIALSVFKGIGFVVVTSLLLFLLMRRAFGEAALASAELAQSEQSLAASQAHLAALIGAARDAIVSVGPNGHVLMFNQAAEQLFQRTAAQALSLPLSQLLTDGADMEAGAYLETSALRPDGTRVPVEIARSVVNMRRGPVSTYIIRDISQRRQAERALRELNERLEVLVAERTRDLEDAVERAREADRLKSAFLATMSHELRTPLNSIIGFTGILLQELAGPLEAEQQRQLEMVRDSSRHLLALINDILDLSRIEADQLILHPQTFEPATAIQAVADSLQPSASQRGLTLSVDLAGELPLMNTDRRRFEQILLNLLSNGLKFTAEGQVQSSARALHVPAGPGDSEHCWLQVQVSDTGIGIRQQDLKALFEPFRQLDRGLARQHEGTGLGLAISRRLARLLGGALSARSDPGKGSVFTLTLPREMPA